MKIPKRVKQVAEQIARNAQKQRRLNSELNTLLEDMGVDIDDALEVIGYLEGDCATDHLYNYLEEL